MGWKGSLKKWFTRGSSPKNPDMTLGEVIDAYDVITVGYGEGERAYLVVAERENVSKSATGGEAEGTIPSGPDQSVEYNARGEIKNTSEYGIAANSAANGSNGSRSPSEVKQLRIAEGAFRAIGELGTSSPSPFTSFTRQEYNPELRGIEGLKKYDRMRKGDGTVKGTLRLVKTPVLSGRWFIEPASTAPADIRVAEFVWKCLTEFMSIGFTQFLTEALLMCDFGYYMFEKVWEIRIVDGQPRMVWKKLAPRHPMDVASWHYDLGGGPLAVEMYPPTMDVFQDNIIIPIEKLLVFSFDREAGNIEGVSVLRSAYKHWYYKEQLYKIDAIQKERHGIGIPVIKLPPNWSTEDKRAAEELGRNLRTNERAHVVLPPQWDLIFAKVEGNPVDAMKSIEHHDREIEKNVLTSFMGNESGPGHSEDQSLFLKGTRFVADILTEVVNLYGIPQLVDYNFSRGLSGYPKLRARRIGEQQDWRTMSFSLRNLVGAGVIIPDDPLEQFIRREMDIPPPDPTTRREVATPQSPNTGAGAGGDNQPGTTSNPSATVGLPRVGPPRQAPPSPRPASNANAGRDQSGG